MVEDESNLKVSLLTSVNPEDPALGLLVRKGELDLPVNPGNKNWAFYLYRVIYSYR